MPIEFACTHCGKQLRTPDETAGRQAKCPQCGGVVPIPQPQAFAAAPAAPAAEGGQDEFNFNPYQSPSVGAAYRPRGASYGDFELASLGARLGGSLLDGLFMVGGMIPGLVLVFVFAAGNGRPRPGNEAEAIAGIVGPMIVAYGGMLVVGIVNWILIAQSGQSLGKKIVGTRIVRLDGSLPGFGYGVALRSWIPAIIGLIPWVGGLFGLVDILFIFGQERRCVHDHIAGTRVVVA